ncbi:hypothetical protein LOC67_08200 [Stieleria sp. JC731]|uniref:hypothetical protein n=1 Tax=Pirellulaceae TaxID=2691357 RepID=UPI001E5804E0|nr:hypothetical protein [Stieleria sp. JC731]MCC9600540.1 hypothetical protein [Stieleria sp. JC731]
MESPQAPGRQSESEPVLPSRLLPRISFQSMMILTAVCAVIAAVVSAAGDGGDYAMAAAIGLAFVLSSFALFVIFFLLSWSVSMFPRLVGVALMFIGVQFLVARLAAISLGDLAVMKSTVALVGIQVIGLFLLIYPIGREKSDVESSPFARDQLPPQLLAPRDPTDS